MTDSPSEPAPYKGREIPIEIEIVSDDEMALLETALTTAAARVSLAGKALLPPVFQRSARSIGSVAALSKRRPPGCSEPDLEDFGNRDGAPAAKDGNAAAPAFLDRFRRKKGLSVTDITGAEWCEKQMEFVLLSGKRKTTKAMKAGSARHEKLEQEFVQKVKVRIKSKEDGCATRFLNFITGAHQLLFEGFTRELPITCFLEDAWVKGVIDEVRMPVNGTERNPILVDIKTRVRNSLPSEPQRRNGRFQLMCYKHMWDKSVGENFPTKQFFDYYNLNPYHILSEDIRDIAANAGLPAENLNEILRYYTNTCSMLPKANDQLILRYELQKDHSVLGEDWFTFDPDWSLDEIRTRLEFLRGEREATYTPKQERWKCSFCEFASVCPARAIDAATSGSADFHQGSTYS
ncbi:exonuclease V, chloroplastic isoform X1 [Eucalyptus grandis]|uniref:exonuclease V, chloroplastic isoform X1 n=1 Tax=Eucalyptus grandis TaxID=71139 RepID=UPI00192E8802|nr:exonuclease V, chloroplastic isoform X1 [Eucalyptus grandis]